MYKNTYLGELSKLGLVCPVSAARMTIRVLLKKSLLLRSLPSFCCCYSVVRFTKETSDETFQLANKPSKPGGCQPLNVAQYQINWAEMNSYRLKRKMSGYIKKI